MKGQAKKKPRDEILVGHQGIEAAISRILEVYATHPGICPRQLGLARYHLRSGFGHLNKAVENGNLEAAA